MQSLKEVLPVLRREILAALEAERDLPTGAQLEAERVTLSLTVLLRSQPAKDGAGVLELWVPVSGLGGHDTPDWRDLRAAGHSLTIEFRLGSKRELARDASSQPEGETNLQKAAGTSSPGPEQVWESLGSIFGVPGFDSSARATVFREALAGISDDQARAIADSLRGMPTPGITPAAARARSLVERLVVSAPSGPTRGREVLAEVFYRHSVQSVLRMVREKWKTQEEWLNEPVQRPKPGGGGQASKRNASD